MKKRNKIIYWIATLWLALGMVSTAIVQLIRMEEEVQSVARLGYPVYLLTLRASGNCWASSPCSYQGIHF